MVGGLAKWLRDAGTVYNRLATVLERVESLKGEEAKRMERLSAFLTEMCDTLPKMIGIIERAVREIATI